MKKLILITLTVAAFAGCQKNSTAPASITGKWYLNAIHTTSYQNNSITGQSDSAVVAHTYYASFNADGTGVEYNSVNDILSATPLNFTYTGSGSTITLKFPQQTISGTTYDAYQVNASVITLSNNSLTLQFPDLIYGPLGAKQTETHYFGK